MDITQLAAAHNTAALRFAFIASVEAEANQVSERHRNAAAAEREALQAIIEHVPVSVYDLNLKARYLLSRLAMGEQLPTDAAPALLRSIVQFHS